MAVSGGILAPTAFAQGFQTSMQKSTIVVNGRTFESPYKFVYQGTTYMPIWYVMQVLKQIKGFSVDWNASTHQWIIDGPFGIPNMNASKIGRTSIVMNGKTVESNILTLASTDPSSGQLTTFMPIWYIQQALNSAGFSKSSDSWNGSQWHLSFRQSSSSGNTSGSGSYTPPTTAQITSAIQQYLHESNYGAKNVSGYSPLATATQWFPNPTDIFYNKRIPTSDFVNNKVIQQHPYVIMNKEIGPSGALWVEVEYVGKDSTDSYWMGEQVNPTTGFVTNIQPSLMRFSDSLYPNLAVPKSGGYNFSSDPVNPNWAFGGNLFVIAPPGYNPNSNN